MSAEAPAATGAVDPTKVGREPVAPTYEMGEGEVRAMCARFLAQTEGKPDTKFGCYIIEAADEYSNMGRYVEGSVFYEHFGDQPELLAEEYGPYEDASTFYLVIDHEAGMPIGVLRIIHNSEAGLKAFNDAEELGLGFSAQDVAHGYGADPARTVEVTTLAVDKEYRGDKTGDFTPSLLTYRTLYLEVLRDPRYSHVVAMIDKKAEKNLNLLKFPFSPIFGSGYFDYLGSEETHALIAQTTMFYPHLTYWINQLRSGAAEGGADLNEFLASTIDSLINPRQLDAMLQRQYADQATR